MLRDPARCQAVLVTLPEVTPVTELLELAAELGDELGIALLPTVLNACWPERAGLMKSPAVAAKAQDVKLSAHDKRVLDGATAFGRSRLEHQHEQLERLRGALDTPIIELPRLPTPSFGRNELSVLADALAATRGGPVMTDPAIEPLDQHGSLASAVTNSKLIVTCGPGGVGKTTTAAALGLAAARAGRRVVVMTVDPARRLADALGLAEGAAGDAPHQVTGIDAPAGGELWALMLDAASTFDRLVREQASNRQQAETLLANPVYRAISRSLSGAQEYMAIERLHELHVSGEWDLVIVDTPPSRHAIDMLEAPDRLIGFLSHPVYRALTLGQRTFAKVTNAAASMFLWAVRRLAGPQIVEDTMEFFRSLANIEPGLRRRAGEVSALLRSSRRHVRRGVEPARRGDRRIGASRRRTARRRVPVRWSRDQPDPPAPRRTRRRLARRPRAGAPRRSDRLVPRPARPGARRTPRARRPRRTRR